MDVFGIRKGQDALRLVLVYFFSISVSLSHYFSGMIHKTSVGVGKLSLGYHYSMKIIGVDQITNSKYFISSLSFVCEKYLAPSTLGETCPEFPSHRVYFYALATSVVSR